MSIPNSKRTIQKLQESATVTDSVFGCSAEEWRDVPGYENMYQVSDRGQIRSIRSCWKHGFRVMKLSNDRAGYFSVGLQVGEKKFRYFVHALVALTFIGERPDGMQINHKNGNKKDNNINNLEYLTPSENARHRFRVLGHVPSRYGKARGEKTGSAKFTEQIVIEIRGRHRAGQSMKSLSVEYEVRFNSIWSIVHRKTWKHVGG